MLRILAVSVACLTVLVSMLGDPSRPFTNVAIPVQRVVISARTGPGDLGQADGQLGQAQRTESATAAATATQVVPTRTAVPAAPTATTVPAAPTATAVPAAPTPTAVPSPDATWAALQPELSAAWGTDTPRTIEILDGFLARFPDYDPARDKLYAALVTRGHELAAAGDGTLASEAFLRARDLQPNRAEAVDALLALTPTPTPPPPTNTPVPPAAPPPVRQVQPTPRPAAPPVRVAPTPVPAPRQPAQPAQPAPPAPQPPAPTPTKVPFSVPRGG